MSQPDQIVCVSCGSREGVGRFCQSCGAEQPRVESDPLLGRVIADRYEIVQLISSGGMGRVYRGVQRSLNRPVAVKFIHPHLLTSDVVVRRFMVEAQAASRLHHPNVVTIFDFGRTSPAEQGHLFLVMEHLNGPDLRSVLDGGAPLPLPRVVSILRQILLALAEAHHHGITHRDIKPENVILEPMRDGEIVKVFDFGIAKIGEQRRVTQTGSVFGTPWYMAPEQARGRDVGPSADLYAVGVMMFQMLAGRLPFEGTEPTDVLLQQMSAPRPDPRSFAPERNIPPALAELCVRALSIDPGDRCADALSFADEIERAAALRGSTPDAPSVGRVLASTLPPPPEREPIAIPPLPEPPRDLARSELRSSTPRARTSFDLAVSPDTGSADAGFVGRAEDLAWAQAALREGGARALVLWGRTGSGRSRVLRELAVSAERVGARVVETRAAGPPLSEVGYRGLRRMVAALVGVAENDAALGNGELTSDPAVRAGLRAAFGVEAWPDGIPVVSRRAAAAAALAWGAERACERHTGNIVLAVDDVDWLDGASATALADVLASEPIRRFRVVATSELPPDRDPSGTVQTRQLRGLSRADAERMLGALRSALPQNLADDIDPLYLRQLRYWKTANHHGAAPTTLAALVEWQVRSMPRAHRRLLIALAIVGPASSTLLRTLSDAPSELGDALRALAASGAVQIRDGAVSLTHALFGRVALATAPAGTVAELHVQALEIAEAARESIEIRASYAARGEPRMPAYELVEQAARLRAERGDDEGAIAMLTLGANAARTQIMRGDVDDAPRGLVLLGRQLGTALVEAGRAVEAQGILAEVLDLTAPRYAERALVLEQLSAIARMRQRLTDAGRYLAQAVDIAMQAGDAALVRQLRRPPRVQSSVQVKAPQGLWSRSAPSRRVERSAG